MTETRPSKSSNRWTKRRFLGIPLIGWAVVALAGTAFAAYFTLNLGATGTISLADGINVQFTGTAPVVDTNANCTAVIVDGSNITVNATDFTYGDYCEIAVEVESFGDAQVDAAFQGFGMSNTGSFPGFQSNWDYGPGETGNWCGTVIPVDGTPTVVKVRLDVQWDSVPGTNYPFNTANDGFQFVPAGTENC